MKALPLRWTQRFGTCMQVWNMWSGRMSTLLSVKLAMSGVEHTVTHTICYLQLSWPEQTWLWVGNGADINSDLDTVFCVWPEVDWWESVLLLILVCLTKVTESHVAWKPFYVSVGWQRGLFLALLSYWTSKINIKWINSILEYLFWLNGVAIKCY